jgi:hypothetical protein
MGALTQEHRPNARTATSELGAGIQRVPAVVAASDEQDHARSCDPQA